MADATMRMPREKNDVFHLFTLLPKELRLEIWELVIPTERLIRISLKPHEGRRYELAAAEPRYMQRNSLRKPISGERYRAVVDGTNLNSKFLRVSREARDAALRFYRVHLPAYMTGATCSARTTLYLNPEHDVLHVDAAAPVTETLIDFMWDLKAYDPRDVGLLKLAVDLDGFCANDLQYIRKCDVLLVRQRLALIETLSQLREVWFVNVHSRRRWTKIRPGLITTEPGAHCALPIRAEGPSFERLGDDERPEVGDELAQFFLGDIDPREMLFRWRRVLRTWGIEHHPDQVDYRILFARSPDWRGLSRPSGELHGAMNNLALADDGDDVASAPVHTRGGYPKRCSQSTVAVGFWLFPVQAVGTLRESDRLYDMDFRPCRVSDMRDCWPELVLSKCH